MNDAYDIEISLKLLKLLKTNPELTQRQMNSEMGVSLGKINYCISKLVKEGLIKIEKFRKSDEKSRYRYLLTPEGLAEIGNLTLNFLSLRVKEYNRIEKEIRQLSRQIGEIDPDLFCNSGLMKELKKIQI